MADTDAPSTAGVCEATPSADLAEAAASFQDGDYANARAAVCRFFLGSVADLPREEQGQPEAAQSIAREVVKSLPPDQAAAVEQQANDVAIASTQGRAIADARGDSPTPRVLTADPIDLAIGQLVYRRVDIHLDAAGIPFEIARTYRSQARYPSGPLGSAWDYSLNLWIREESPDEVVVSSGELREDRYKRTTPRPDALDQEEYFAPPDGFHSTLSRGISGLFRLTRPDGVTYDYKPDAMAGSMRLHRIERISDRFGNCLEFRYPATGSETRVILNDKAAQPTRVVRLLFDDLGRLVTVSDYTGRTVNYAYDDYDDLIAVTMPSTRQSPYGRTTFYSYSSATGPIMHQLTSVVDSDGRRYLDVEYGVEDGFVEMGRVVRLRDDEGEWLVEYADLANDGETGLDVAAKYAITTRPTGHRIEYWFNTNGSLLAKREGASPGEGSIRNALTLMRCNLDGQVVATLSPLAAATPLLLEGTLSQSAYGREAYMGALGLPLYDPIPAGSEPTASERRAFGNRVRELSRGRPSDVGWPPLSPFVTLPSDILQLRTYTSDYQQLSTEADPREPGRVTRYDYRATDGALKSTTYPATTTPDGILGVSVQEAFDIDSNGRLLSSVDAQGNITKREYFGSGDRVEGVPGSGTMVSVEGFLKAVTTGTQARTAYVINARGVRTRITDPRGYPTDLWLDDTDLPLEIDRYLDRAGAKLTYATRFRYNAEAKLTRQERDLQDETGKSLDDGVEVRHFTYDDVGLLLHESIGGQDATTWLTTRHRYDCEGLLSRSTSPGGKATRFQYNPRRALIATTRGFGTSEASTSRILYDLDGRKYATIDARGVVTWTTYDQLGRAVRVVRVADRPIGVPDDRPFKSREGHTQCLEYDKLGNVVLERVLDWQAPQKYVLLSRTEFVFDERGRQTKIIRDLWDDPIAASLNDFDLSAGPPPGAVRVEAWQFLDGDGRLLERREGVITGGPDATLGTSTCYHYDADGRQTLAFVQLLDAAPAPIEVTRTETTYDPAGNVVRVDQVDHEYDATGKALADEVISRASEYDSLNRRVADIDGFGNRTTYTYDSRDLKTMVVDPAGHVTSYEYDLYGRLTGTRQGVDANLELVTRTDLDSDGRIKTLHRLTIPASTVVDTGYEYDGIGRRTAEVVGFGTPAERRTALAYDLSDNVTHKTFPSGLAEVRTFNERNDLVRVDFQGLGTRSAQLTFERFDRDGLGRITEAQNDGFVTVMSYDSLGREVEETQQGLGGGPLTVRRTFDGRGNCRQLVYPSGRAITLNYDLANRLTQIDDIKRGTPNVSVPGNGVRLVLHRDFVGARRRSDRLGNGAVARLGYDAVGRTIEYDYQASNGTSLLRLTQLHDATGRRAVDWQSGAHAMTPDQLYGYDDANRLMSVRYGASKAPKLTPLLPPALPRDPLGGQALVDAAILGAKASGPGVTYEYDGGSNCLDRTDGQGASLFPVDTLDQLQGNPYDLDGNPTQPVGGAAVFDARGRLVESATVGFSAMYDALGRRILVEDGPEVVRVVYDGSAALSEYNDQGKLLAEYVVVAPPDDQLQVAVHGNLFYLHRDLVGSPRVVTDEKGDFAARYEFDAYGRDQGSKPLAECRFRFMGREWDESISLYHFRARHYDPSIARFLQRDPASASPGRSAYEAFRSSPLLYVDPLGTSAKSSAENESYEATRTPVGPYGRIPASETALDEESFEAAGSLAAMAELHRERSVAHSVEAVKDLIRRPLVNLTLGDETDLTTVMTGMMRLSSGAATSNTLAVGRVLLSGRPISQSVATILARASTQMGALMERTAIGSAVSGLSGEVSPAALALRATSNMLAKGGSIRQSVATGLASASTRVGALMEATALGRAVGALSSAASFIGVGAGAYEYRVATNRAEKVQAVANILGSAAGLLGVWGGTFSVGYSIGHFADTHLDLSGRAAAYAADHWGTGVGHWAADRLGL